MQLINKSIKKNLTAIRLSGERWSKRKSTIGLVIPQSKSSADFYYCIQFASLLINAKLSPHI